jgi:hypothetical protein
MHQKQRALTLLKHIENIDQFIECVKTRLMEVQKQYTTADLIPQCEAYILEKTKIAVSLKIKPMDEGFDLPNVVNEYSEHKAFDPRDNFCWLDFDEKYRGKVFTSLEEIIEQTRRDLNRVICTVEQGCGFIVKKTDCKDNLMDIIDKKSSFTDIYFKYFENKKPKEMSFKRYLQIFGNDMNRYRSIDFAPNNPDPKLFNLWTGFQAQMLPEDEKKCADNFGTDITSIQLILNHIREIYCSDCDVSYEYFLDLLYFIIKYPEKPLGIATFIYSKNQGSGKNVILDFLQEFVFGNNISFYTTGLDTVLEKHNHLLKNKKIVIVDELASSSDSFMSNFDKLKSMMTGPYLTINPKSIQQYMIKNVLSWFLISNHDDCLRIEPSDRRYFCLDVSEKYIGDKVYFKKLADTFTADAGNTFFTYIMNRGDSRDVNIRVPPMNAFKKRIISKGWSTSIRFLFEIKDNEYEDEEETEIKAYELFNDYKEWCCANHERVKSSSKFHSDIKDNITKNRKAAGMYYDLKTIKI